MTIPSFNLSSYWLIAFLHPPLIFIYFAINRNRQLLYRWHFVFFTFIVFLVAKIVIGLIGSVHFINVIGYSFWSTWGEAILVGMFWWLMLVKFNEIHRPYKKW